LEHCFEYFEGDQPKNKKAWNPTYRLEALGEPDTNKKSPRRSVGILLIIPCPLKFPRFQDETPSECFKLFNEESQIYISV